MMVMSLMMMIIKRGTSTYTITISGLDDICHYEAKKPRDMGIELGVADQWIDGWTDGQTGGQTDKPAY